MDKQNWKISSQAHQEKRENPNKQQQQKKMKEEK